MNIATILFTYNRSEHTEKVLRALSKNTILPEKLYIFQDGLKTEAHRDEWERVRRLIERVDWCDTELIYSEKNKGLAVSIVDGINYAFKDNDAVIVLEDDCVPALDFMNFMYQCFEKYHSHKEIYSVSGYSWPIDLNNKGKEDIYYCGRISSYGWGTWKDRWVQYQRDYDCLRRMMIDRKLSRKLALWGADLPGMLVDNLLGKNDSWAVFWALNVIEKGGFCIAPYKNFIKNIGFDGSGVHCIKQRKYEDNICNDKNKKYKLPENTCWDDDVLYKYASLYGSYTALKKSYDGKDKVLVFGAGDCWHRYEKEINEKYWVEAFVDNYKKGFLAGIPIVKPNDIFVYDYKYIFVMIDSKQSYEVIRQQLVDIGISESIIKDKDYLF